MDLNQLSQIISNLGVPVAMTIYIIKELKGTMASLTDAVNKNTLITQKLYIKMGGEDEDGDSQHLC